MNLRGKIKLASDAVCKNWVLTVLLLLMCFITLYMIDTVMSDFFYQNNMIEQLEAPFAASPEKVHFVDYQEYTMEQGECSRVLQQQMSEINGISYYGRFCENGVKDWTSASGQLLDVLVAERSLMDLCSLKLTEAQKQQLIEYEGEYCPVLAGADYMDRISVGDIFSFWGEEKNCIIVGYLPKGAMWIKSGLFHINNLLSLSLDHRLLLFPQDYSRFDNSGGMPQQIYFVCEPENQETVYNQIYDEAAKASCMITIKSEGDMLQAEREKNNLGDDKLFLSTLMIVIIAVISMSATAVMNCMLRRKSYGVMYAIGISTREISQMIIIENTVIILLSALAAWIIRAAEIKKHYLAYAEAGTQGMLQSAWRLSHQIQTPVVLAVCGLLMLLAASILPVMFLRRDNPVEMIRHTG